MGLLIEEIKDQKERGSQWAAAEHLAQRRQLTRLPQPQLLQSSVFKIPDRVTISAEAREKEDLAGRRRVNLESWALSSGSQTKSQIHKQQGAVSFGKVSVRGPKLGPSVVGADLGTIWSATSSNSLDQVSIAQAAADQVVRKGNAPRKTISFPIEPEAPVTTLQ